MSVIRQRILACVVLLVVASACGGSTTVEQLTAPSSTIRSGIAPTTRTSTNTATTDPLESLLIVAVPSSYVRQTDDVGDTGPSDLTKAAAKYAAAEKKLIEDLPVAFMFNQLATNLIKPNVAGIKTVSLDGGYPGSFFWENIDLQ